MTRVAPGIAIAVIVVAALAGCRGALPSAPATAVSPGPVLATPTPAASADLSDLDAALQKADGAVQQSQGDLQAGDASAAKNDDGG